MRSRGAFLAFLGALLAGGLLRFLDLTVRPLHHDEGVNVLFLLDLLGQGRWRYDPSNYHGPLLYFTVAPLLKILGLKTVVLRLAPAAIGTALIAVFWPLRHAIGERGAAAAAWLLALSPVSVYFARDLIHETWYVGAGALLAGSAVAYAASGRAGLLVLAWAGFALLVATKETAPFLVGALGAGGLAAGLLVRGRAAPGALARDLWRRRVACSWGLIAATAICLLLFSSFFTNPSGFLDMFRAYAFWAKTGAQGAGHEKPWPYFFEILWRYERVAYVLGAAGLVVALARREAAAGLGVATAAFLAVHALIPYKTPWLVIGALPWLAGSAGYLLDRAVEALPRRSHRLLALLLFAATLPAVAREAWRLSFVDYDDERDAIVYSQTRRQFLDLVVSLRAAALSAPARLDTPLDVMSADHFPLNWYVRDFSHVGYWGSVTAPRPGALLLVARDSADALRGTLEGEHFWRTFPLRPGVDLALFVPAEAFERARALIPEPGKWSRTGPPEPLPALDPAEVPAALAPGLLARGYAGSPGAGDPVFVEPGRPVRVDYEHGQNREWTGPFEIEWTGFLQAPADGLYRFSLESDDGSSLEIDGRVVVDNSGMHAQRRRDGAVRLAGGFHHLRISYSDFGGGAKLFWRWRRPGALADDLVPETALSHGRDQAGTQAP